MKVYHHSKIEKLVKVKKRRKIKEKQSQNLKSENKVLNYKIQSTIQL